MRNVSLLSLSCKCIPFILKVGTWAGNLMLTHDHDNFPSDVFTMMEAAGATVTIGQYVCIQCL